jgi:hypothetical protein
MPAQLSAPAEPFVVPPEPLLFPELPPTATLPPVAALAPLPVVPPVVGTTGLPPVPFAADPFPACPLVPPAPPRPVPAFGSLPQAAINNTGTPASNQARFPTAFILEESAGPFLKSSERDATFEKRYERGAALPTSDQGA